MTDKREIAQNTLQTALDVVMKQRQNAHGDAEDSFSMIADLWDAYLRSAHDKAIHQPVEPLLDGRKFRLSAFDVAQMMVLLKIARSVHGDKSHADHYVDAAGYSALAAMLGAK